MTPKEALHILRNPEGYTVQSKVEARLIIADGYEKVLKQRNDLLEFIKCAPVSSGVCCCGGDVEKHHGEHSPVDMWDYAVEGWVKEIEGGNP